MRRARTILAGTLALAVAGGSARAQRQSVLIGVEDAAAPWSQADGTGYANDLVRAAFGAAGVDVTFRVLPYARCKQAVIRGTLPACFSMSRAPELAHAVLFARQPLFEFACDFFAQAGATRYASIEALPRGAVVGTVLGYEYPRGILSRLAARGVVLDSAASETLLLKKLAAGRITMAIVNRDAVKSSAWVAGEAGVADRVVSAFQLGSTPSYIGFSLANARGRQLAALFDGGFARITASGERERIAARWIARSRAEAAR